LALAGPAFNFWTEDSDTNIWEHCGLFEGDIMLHRELLRNGLVHFCHRQMPTVIGHQHHQSMGVKELLPAFHGVSAAFSLFLCGREIEIEMKIDSR